MTVVFHHGSAVDFLLLLPVMRGLEGRLTVIAGWSRADLAARLLGASPMDIEMFEFTRLHAEGGPTRVSPAVREVFEQADCIVSYVSDGRDAWAKNVARLAPSARLLFIPEYPQEAASAHATDWQAQQWADGGLTVSPRNAEQAGHADGSVLVHPGGGSAVECWPRERFEALVMGLREAGRAVLPVFGDLELERWPAAECERWQHALGATVCRGMGELYHTLAGASQVVASHGVPAHLAAQMGVPTLTLLGPNLERTAPRGPGAQVLAPSDGAGVGEVVSAVMRG